MRHGATCVLQQRKVTCVEFSQFTSYLFGLLRGSGLVARSLLQWYSGALVRWYPWIVVQWVGDDFKAQLPSHGGSRPESTWQVQLL